MADIPNGVKELEVNLPQNIIGADTCGQTTT